MAALEISKELSGLFKKLEQGIGLLNPDDRSIFAATTVNKCNRPTEIYALHHYPHAVISETSLDIRAVVMATVEPPNKLGRAATLNLKRLIRTNY